MTYSTKATVVCGAVLAAASLLVAAPSASARAVPRDGSSGTWLHLTVTRGDILPPDPGTVHGRGARV
ncbi:serine protease, partial [Streptomyces sp. NPDC058964]